MDQILDVSALPAPEPLERVLDALADLPSGDRLCVIHHREPYPLYDLLKRMGYRWETQVEGERYRILISPLAKPVSTPRRAWSHGANRL